MDDCDVCKGLSVLAVVRCLILTCDGKEVEKDAQYLALVKTMQSDNHTLHHFTGISRTPASTSILHPDMMVFCNCEFIVQALFDHVIFVPNSRIRRLLICYMRIADS